MARLFVGVLAIASFAMTANEAFAIGCDLPPDILAQQGTHCVHGYMVNWTDTFFFAGDTAAFNKFIEGYGKRDDLKRRVVIHAGTTNARSPWGTPKRDIAADWSFYVWNTARPDPRNPAPSQVEVWLGSRLKLDELKIPVTVEVVSGGEIEKFVQERQPKNQADGDPSKNKQGKAP